jgi:hypothetical protein
MNELDGCQLPCLPRMSTGIIKADRQALYLKLKRLLARPWNYIVKKQLKSIYSYWAQWKTRRKDETLSSTGMGVKSNEFLPRDRVRVRSFEEIQGTLNPFTELKGCAFLPYMHEFCGTTQVVLQPMERFLDERDYKVKRARGVVLLENVICRGTPVFGRCDRGCHLFWRVEWLEKIDEKPV